MTWQHVSIFLPYFLVSACLGLSYHHTLSRRMISSNSFARQLANRSPFNEEGEWIEPDIISCYIPKMGLESKVYNYGNAKRLSLQEYMSVFASFPGLKAASLNESWPDERTASPSEKQLTQIAIVELDELLRADVMVENELSKFRKTILSLEKYRINDPKSLAEKYSSFLRCCLAASNQWGSAANAIEYAGINFREHIHFQEQNFAEVNATSLWIDALTRLLDIEYQIKFRMPSANSNQSWDQKHFEQAKLDAVGEITVRDMMLNILRLAMRIAFASKEDVQLVLLHYPATSTMRGTVYLAIT